jgi:hypothetical protein
MLLPLDWKVLGRRIDIRLFGSDIIPRKNQKERSRTHERFMQEPYQSIRRPAHCVFPNPM